MRQTADKKKKKDKKKLKERKIKMLKEHGAMAARTGAVLWGSSKRTAILWYAASAPRAQSFVARTMREILQRVEIATR